MNIVLSRDQIRSVDRLAVERYKISGVALMENAGRNAAAIIDDAYGPAGKTLICCGAGNNGGDGCVIARHLHNRGWQVRLMLAGSDSQLTPDTAANYAIVQAMNVPITVALEWETQRSVARSIRDDEVVVDALLGTGFRGEVRSPTAETIGALNAAGKRATVAIDVPSGLDCDTGTPSNAAIRADLTITFAAMKRGFLAEAALACLGRIEVADIGTPPELIAEVAATGA